MVCKHEDPTNQGFWNAPRVGPLILPHSLLDPRRPDSVVPGLLNLVGDSALLAIGTRYAYYPRPEIAGQIAEDQGQLTTACLQTTALGESGPRVGLQKMEPPILDSHIPMV